MMATVVWVWSVVIARIRKIGDNGCCGLVRIGADGGRGLGMVGCDSANTENL